MKRIKLIAFTLALVMITVSFASCSKPLGEGMYTGIVNETSLIAQEELWNAEQYQIKLDKEMSDTGLLTSSEPTILTEKTACAFLGRGYNVVKSNYYNASDVDTTMPRALDMAALAKEQKLGSIDDTGTKGAHYMGTTLSEYQSSVSSSLSLEASYGLFTKVGAEFNLSKDTNVSTLEKAVFISDMNYLRKERQYATVGTTPRKYADIDFLNIIDAKLPETAEEQYEYFVNNLFETYGTHILTSVVLGGRYQMNFVYNNVTDKKQSKIASDLTVTYEALKGKASGTVTADQEKVAKEMISNSTFTVQTCGGSVEGIGNSYETAAECYKEWSKSIDDGKDLTFCDINPKTGTVPMPVWEFANNEETKTAIKKAFTEYSVRNGGLFQGIDDELGKTRLPKYIEKVYIGTGSSRQAAIDDISHQISQDFKAGRIDNITAVPHSYDLKRGTGGDFVLIGYSTTYEKSKAITDIKIDISSKNGNKKHQGYTCIDKDLNASFSSRRTITKNALYPYVYVQYSKLPENGQPIEALGVSSGGTKSYGSDTKGWSYCCLSDSEKIADINTLACSKYVIHIAMYSTPKLSENQ